MAMTKRSSSEPNTRASKRRRSKAKAAASRNSENHSDIVRRVARTMHDVHIDGVDERFSVAELMLLKLRNIAATGNLRAIKAYDRYMRRYRPEVAEGVGVLVAPGEMTPEQWGEMVENHNRKADARRAEELRQKALSRKDGGPNTPGHGPSPSDGPVSAP